MVMTVVCYRQEWPVSKMEKREDFILACVPFGRDRISEMEFELKMCALLSNRLLTVVQILLLPNEEFRDLMEEYKEHRADGAANKELELGLDYVDDSDWSEMVLLACIEAKNLFGSFL